MTTIASEVLSSPFSDFLESICLRTTWTLLHFVWQGSLIGFLFYMVNTLTKAQSARLRCLTAVMTMGILAVTPPITFCVLSVSGTSQTSTESLMGMSANWFTGPESTRNRVAQRDEILMHEGSVGKGIHSARGSTVQQVAHDRFSPISTALVIVYLIGASAMLIRLALGMNLAGRMVRRATPVGDQRLNGIIREISTRWSLRVVPALVACTRVTIPVVVGVFRPMILIPPAMLAGVSIHQLEAMLIHELAHIRRYDPLINLAQRIIEAFLFFHPAVWYVSQRLSLEREHACDELVISSGWDRRVYCEALVAMARFCLSSQQQLNTGAVLLAASGRNPSQLKQRMLRILGESTTSNVESGRTGLICVIVMLVGVSLAFTQFPTANHQRKNASAVIDGVATEVVKAQESHSEDADSATTDEQVTVITGGVRIVVEGNGDGTDPDSGLVDLSADRVVIFRQDERVDDGEVIPIRILIEGNVTIPSVEISRLIGVQPGQPVTREQIRDDVSTLVKTRWFSSVEPTIRRADDGLVLVFKVLERPIVRRVEYRGLKKIKQSVFDAMIGLKPGSPFDASSNREAARRIEEYYHGIGFPFAMVRLEKGDDCNDREVVFAITEGPKVHVTSVNYSGNTETIDGLLKTKTRTKTCILNFYGGKYDPAMHRDDVDVIKQYYHAVGFFDVDVKQELRFSADRSKVEILYQIDEGPRYRIGDIDVTGNKTLSEAQIRGMLTVTEGSDFNGKDLQKDMDTLRTTYGQQGRLFCRVDAIPRFTEQAGIVDIDFRIEEDKVYRIRQIQIPIYSRSGERRSPNEEEEIPPIRPGDLADPQKIEALKNRLESSHRSR